MKGFGTFALIVGICWVIFALSMDVSVSTGMGRVNNLGLMADRQVHAIVGGMIALAGLVMMLLGGKGSASGRAETTEHDTRPCPLCAETIKNAAIKCKHCGVDIEAMPRITPAAGWTVRIPCRPGMEFEAMQKIVSADGWPCDKPDGAVVVIGPYAEKQDAVEVLKNLRISHSIFGELSYKA
ncbi:hypothetical protein HBN70_06535 [Pseudomonas lundensis]|uniref:hypothetical protein n=1 Tax=Pseudomonas lundensis TaxID=86185 RepID=UPI00147321E3|nr:hypothetical protein [Pseudomonas lundensis]NNA20421.1 hypothetical protein [Pseudomonas lundensis]